MRNRIFHAQNRSRSQIIDPNISGSAGYKIWINNDVGNYTYVESGGNNYVQDYINLDNESESLPCNYLNCTYGRPLLLENDADFGGLRSASFFDKDGQHGIYGISSNALIKKIDGIYNDFTLFIVLNYDTTVASQTHTFNEISSFCDASPYNISYGKAWGMNYYGFYLLEKYSSSGSLYVRSIGGTTHSNILGTGNRTGVFVFTIRSMWANGQKKIDLYEDLPIDGSNDLFGTQIDPWYFYPYMEADYYEDRFKCGKFAEIIHYGWKLSNSQIIGISNYLNNKYSIY